MFLEKEDIIMCQKLSVRCSSEQYIDAHHQPPAFVFTFDLLDLVTKEGLLHQILASFMKCWSRDMASNREQTPDLEGSPCRCKIGQKKYFTN